MGDCWVGRWMVLEVVVVREGDGSEEDIMCCLASSN